MESQDSFRARVQALVAEGKLTPEEAESLLGAQATQPADAAPVDSGFSMEPAPQPLVEYTGDVAPNLHLHVAGYTLTVRVDETLTDPQLSASHPDKVRLERRADGWHVARVPFNASFSDRGEGWMERLLGNLVQEGNVRAELTVPAGLQFIEAKVQGGNLTLPDLGAPVHVRVQGGNLTLGHTRELQAKVQGGNLRWQAAVTEGRHDVRIQGGNANVHLEPGSSLRVDGQVVAGNMSASGFPVTSSRKDFVNTSYSGVVGDGHAFLALSVQGGNAKVVAS